MQARKSIWRILFLIVALIAALASSVPAQNSQLGKVEFQTSGSEKAQAHFLRGLAALHSFWYEEALEAFRESSKIEPHQRTRDCRTRSLSEAGSPESC